MKFVVTARSKWQCLETLVGGSSSILVIFVQLAVSFVVTVTKNYKILLLPRESRDAQLSNDRQRATNSTGATTS